MKSIDWHVPSGAKCVLIDDWRLGLEDERIVRLAGAPEDDVAAIAELARVARSGASHLAIAWPAFWWFDFYPGFRQRLWATYRIVEENEQLILFDLSG